MTDIRERIARAVDRGAFGKPFPHEPEGMRAEAQERAYLIADAILAEIKAAGFVLISDGLTENGDDPLLTVDWAAGGRVHNWRNHVGQWARGIWATLTPGQRNALWMDAEERASNEDWD